MCRYYWISLTVEWPDKGDGEGSEEDSSDDKDGDPDGLCLGALCHVAPAALVQLPLAGDHAAATAIIQAVPTVSYGFFLMDVFSVKCQVENVSCPTAPVSSPSFFSSPNIAE